MFRLRKRVSAVLITGAFATLFAGWLYVRLYIPQGGYLEFVQKPLVGMSRFRGYCAGITAAVRDVAHNQAARATYGDASQAVHRRSGLTFLSVGCVTDDGLKAYVAGYNKFVDLHIQWRGIPRNSRRQWEYILENPDLYFQKQSESGGTLNLIVDAPPTRSNNRRETASVTTLRHSSDKNKIVAYELKWGPTSLLLMGFRPIGNAFICAPGPDGSDFLLLRGQRRGSMMTLAYDLRYGSETGIEHTNLP
jgi:hypothetical protein